MVVAYRPATADRWVASRCTAPLWDITPAERENARTSARRTGTMASATGATMDHIRKGFGVEVPASATGATMDHIRKGLGVEVPASATGATMGHIRKGLGVEVQASATGATTDRIRKGLGVEVPASAIGVTTDLIRKGLGVECPASATATAGRQPPMDSGTLETDSSQLEGSSKLKSCRQADRLVRSLANTALPIRVASDIVSKNSDCRTGLLLPAA